MIENQSSQRPDISAARVLNESHSTCQQVPTRPNQHDDIHEVVVPARLRHDAGPVCFGRRPDSELSPPWGVTSHRLVCVESGA